MIDTERLQEARDELHRLLDDKALYHLPVLILANKVDVQVRLGDVTTEHGPGHVICHHMSYGTCHCHRVLCGRVSMHDVMMRHA